MLECIAQPRKPGGLRRLGRIVMVIGLGIAAAGCDEGDTIFGGSSAPDRPEYNLSVDCKTDPNARAVQRVTQTRAVQLVMLSIMGEGYQDRWRVQVFPPDSDLMVSRHNGEEPRYSIHASDLETGEPQQVALTHGGVVLHEVAMEAGQSAMPQSPEPSASPPPDTELEVTLACTLPS